MLIEKIFDVNYVYIRLRNLYKLEPLYVSFCLNYKTEIIIYLYIYIFELLSYH